MTITAIQNAATVFLQSLCGYFIAFWNHVFTFVSPTLNVNSLRSSFIISYLFYSASLILSYRNSNQRSMSQSEEYADFHPQTRERVEQESPLVKV